ncbi:protein ELYS-like, partial [Hetaerina americana]|uniref:protein ELYS-like n=1 Tax=Hetaerina americana TaxID=62018 RepID=UPI003A7F228B
MKLHEPPNCFTKTVEFSAAVVDYVDSEETQSRIYPLLGGLSRDNHYAWISRGPKFEVVAADSGAKVAAWTFGGILKDTNTKVTCAVELPTVENGYGTSVSCLYAVGLDCYMSPGMVCLFDIRGSKIIKAIQVPGKVTSLALVDPGLIPEATTPLAPPLRLARGVLAVGLSPGGQVLLLDLCLSEEDGVVNEGSPLGEEEYMCGTARPHLEHSDELNPSIVVVHAPGDPGTEGPVAPGEHLAIFLNEQSFVNNYFMLKLSESPSSIYRLPLSHVDITASLYVPQLASLFIGFSFGCFQVWDLGNLSLVHTSSLMAEPRNVTFFAFQEPADDPRKYCYIWAVYGRKWDKGIKDGEGRRSGSSSEPSEREGEDDLAFACMHDMYYHSKEWIDAYGWIYQDFVSMHRRFELELSLGDAARTISRCISCFSLDGNLGRDRAPYLRRLETAEFDEVSSAENDLSLCCLVWQSWQVAEDGTPCNLQHSLTVFDLNQWYREQMPSGASSLMLFSSDLNGDCLSQGVSSHPGHPHLVTYTLPFVTEKTMSANGIPLLFARINPTSISRFCPAAVPIPEEHLFPSALAFESSFLLGSKCVIKMSTPGLQRSLLAILRNRGSRTYLYPSALFHECITAGLKPLYVDIHNPASTPVAEQRKFLLSLALEYHMLSYLIRCAVDTANGCASSLGVTLSFFMSWVKHRSSVIRECINELSKPLFECGGTLLPDPQAARLMGLCGRQLKHLSTLLKEILKRCVSWIFVDELKEIEQWCEVLGILALHIQVVQWFCYVGLLPELADEDSAAAEIEASNIGAPRIPYPAKVLTAIYEERRKVLRSIPGVSNVSDILFIDGAVQACGVRLTQETWRISGSDTSGSYPPPSLQALLRTYLLDGLPVEDKHCLVIYLFLDLAALLDNERYASSISQLIKFPSAFSLSPSIIKLTQAFWLLDHKDFESAINMFLEPLICPQDIKLWQHRCVVRAFLSQGEPQKALKYVRVRQPPLGGLEDLKLNLTLLLENGLVHEAFNYQRKHRNNQNSHELLQHFFDGCGDLKELRWVLQNSLTPPEEEGLVSFLTSQKDAKAHEMLVMYYLQRSRFIEALSINDKERPSKKNEFPRGAIDTTRRKMKTVRDAIVSGYASAMPPVTRHLAAYCARHAANIRSWREVPKPIPLSVVINRAKLDPSAMSVRTKSTLIGTMLNKARETWNPPPLPPLMPPTPRPSLRTPQPPLSMQSSRSKRKREDEEGSETSQLTAKNLFNSPARSSVDLIPFICTPVAPSLPRSRNGDGQPLIFPSQMKSLSNLEDGTPSKRPCTSSSSQAPTTSSPIENDETSLRSSALQLLLTPVVPKKNRKADGMDGLLNDDYSSTGTEGSTPPREKLPRTPHSILKVRKTRDMTAESPSFATDYYQEEENEGVHEEDEGQSLGRLIRFQLPTGLTPSPTMASPIQWPTHSRGDRSGSERELKVPTSKSPLSRSPIKELVKTRVQPSPRTRPSPRTPIQPSPRSSIQPSPRPSIQPSPAKKSSLTPVRREFVSSTKTTTKVKTVRESFVEDELERVTERKGPRTRSSIHVNEKLPLKRKLQAEASSDESGEFHSFEEPKNVETVEEEGVGSSPAEGKRGTIILTDSYIKLFGSPYQESKRLRPSLLFKDDEEEVDDEMEENEEEEEGLPQEIEGIEATEPATLESKDPERQEAVALDEESEKVADEELMEDEVEVGEIVDKSKPRLLEIPVHDDYLAKEEKVEDEVALEGEKVSEVPQEVERTEADVKRGIHEVEEADADGPPSLVALPLEKVMKSEGKAVVEGERGEGEVGIYESSAGDVNATVEKQHGMFRLDTRETSLDEMVEEGTNRLSTVEEVASIVEKEEEKKYAMGEINEGQDIREGMKSQEVAEEEAKAKAGGVEADEDETEGDGKGEDDQELDASGKSVEELSPEVAEQGERRDEESEGEGEEPEDDDDVVVISSTEEDEEEEEDEEGQSGRESVGDKAAEAHGGDSPWGPMLGETEEEKEYWGEYEYEEEMEGYDGNRGEGHSGSQEEEEEELENENPRKTWITKWEKESGENNELGVGEEEGDE